MALRNNILANLDKLYIYNHVAPITREEKEILEWSEAQIRCATLQDVELIEKNWRTSERVERLLSCQASDCAVQIVAGDSQ